MIISPQHSETIPLATDELGTIRVAGSRVTLDVLAEAWRAGATPEQIADQFDSLKLPDVYAVITWMLRHPEDLGEYLERRNREAIDLRDRVVSLGSQDGLRERLIARARQLPGN